MNGLKSCLLLLIFGSTLVQSSCPTNFFDCGNDRCIAHFWKCDGEDDCGNWADELSCHNLEMKPIIKDCPVNHSHCGDTHNTCVPNKWLCDGMEDCANGSDEKNCTTDAVKCVGFSCHNFECIPLRWKCDGIYDCADNSDEFNCPKPKKNKICDKEHGFYQCMTGECIPHHKVCDNHKDCPQGDDEGTECRSNGCHKIECSQLCFIAPEGPQCYCREGFDIHSDNKTCIDRNECKDNKMTGLCSQSCVNTNGGYKCKCFEDYQLVHNKTCVVKDGEPLLLFSNSDGIRGLWLQSGRYFPVYHSSEQAIGIDFLVEDERVYWVSLDNNNSGVYSVDLSGQEFRSVITSGLKSPEDLAIDWIARNVYITDSELNAIVVCRLTGEHICASNLFKDLDRPRAVVVDPSKRIMFWTEWGTSSGIYQSAMDGSLKHKLITDEVVWPNGLALDSVANRLYWTEAKFGKIEFYDFDTKHRKTVIDDKVFHPFSIAVFEDSMYWSDWMTYSLETSHKFSGHNHTSLIRELNQDIMGVHVFHPLTQKQAYNPCWLHLCSHMCLLTPSRRYSCVCPDHMVLSKDNQTCVNKTDHISHVSQDIHNHIQTPRPHTRPQPVTTPKPTNSPKPITESTTRTKKIRTNRPRVHRPRTYRPQTESPQTDSPQKDIVMSTNSNSDRKSWLTLFIAVLVVITIVLLVIIIIRKDDYSAVRNVLYKRGDQLKGAIVRFQNPIFNKNLRQTDDEEPLNADTKSLNEERY